MIYNNFTKYIINDYEKVYIGSMATYDGFKFVNTERK